MTESATVVRLSVDLKHDAVVTPDELHGMAIDALMTVCHVANDNGITVLDERSAPVRATLTAPDQITRDLYAAVQVLTKTPQIRAAILGPLYDGGDGHRYGDVKAIEQAEAAIAAYDTAHPGQ